MPGIGYIMSMENKIFEKAYLAGGCFWCLEAAFEQVPGVRSVVSGYMGGSVDAPSYREVCAGSTGHAETVEITFDPGTTGFGELLDVFWRIHDPTTRDRQGADIGTQYRSCIFHVDERQREIALDSMRRAADSFPRPIVTGVESAPRFWPAEEYHQGYFRAHPEEAYCRIVIAPKLKKAGF